MKSRVAAMWRRCPEDWAGDVARGASPGEAAISWDVSGAPQPSGLSSP